MRATVWKALPILAALFLVLTYLLVRAAAPDPVLHERVLQALRELTLDDAALHRDVLKARAGLLPHYDPLTRAVDGLRGAVETLRAAGRATPGAGTELGPHVEALAAEVAEQEALVEAFKSDNALLQNSLMYFTYASRELAGPSGAERQPVRQEVGTLANAMLRFLRDRQPEHGDEAKAALDRLDRLPAPPPVDEEIRSLVAHGRIVLERLPETDRTLARLLSTETAARARDFQDAYLDQHARLESRARLFRVLLYLASVLLLAHLGYLFLRLRANARALAERSAALSDRLAFESLVTEISADFIDLPVDRLDDGIVRALGRLGEHMGVHRAYLLLFGDDGRDVSRTYAWTHAAADPPGDRVRDLLEAFEQLEEDGTAHVPSVEQLPPGPERAALESRGLRSWLCLRVGLAGRRLALLGFDATRAEIGFDATRAEKRWSADDVALLRTVAEILAHALERRRGEAERDALETQLRHAQRMEAIGTLAGGIAHDFNNVLGAILGHAELAAAKLPRSSRPRRHIEQVRQAGLRAKGVVDQILAFGRRTDREHRPVRMRPVVEEAVALLSASLPRTVAIRPTFRDDGAAVPGDATQLQQVIVNLCTNAAQAMDGRGTVELVLDTVEVAGERILSHGTLAEGRHVRLAVTDTGHGMDEATMARIFEPFFTTKGPGAGTGLGLSTVHGIVADHGGALNVQSRPGAGSTFEVYLARAEASPAADGRAGEPPPAGRGETILLVDDERSLVRLGEEMLAALGYEPVGFQSGAEALAAFEADPRRFDLLLADEVMPGMTGSQLAAAVHRVRPDLPIVLMTGHREPAGPDRLRAAGIREVLEKPLLSADIAASLARHLNPRGARPSTR